MAEYYTPGVYTERLKNNSLVIEGVSTSIAGFVGVAKRGKFGEAVFVTSWSDYVDKFAYGLESGFYKDSYLGFSVYSFFNNGGSKCYVSRVATSSIATAKATVALSGERSIVFTANDEGAWANSMKVSCVANDTVEDTFDLTFSINGVTETHTQLSNVEGDEKYFLDYLNVYSNLAHVLTGDKLEAFEAVTFDGGNDGEEGISDNDYLKALNVFDSVDDVTLLAIPGQTSKAVHTGFIDFIDNHEFVCGVLDAPMAYETMELKELRKTLACDRGMLVDTWHKVNDPLSSVSGKYRTIPSSGGYLGVVARTIESIGPWKAPAGTEAKLRGAIELVFDAKRGDTDILNPLGIVSIVTKPNYGIVVWGARSISNDSNYKYVSDVLFDIYIRKSVQLACQPFVFEPNKGDGDGALWNRIIATCESFLEYIRQQGGLVGSPEQAYYVKCDEELNPEPMVKRGYCITEVGYASAKPAEFVVFRFKNEVSSQS